MLNFDPSFLNYMTGTCILAGKTILSIYAKKHQDISYKEDNSPVTEADLRSNDGIVSNLIKFDSTIPVLSEESNQSTKCFEDELFWAVDPLDGTKEFLNKTDDFTVNIGLIFKKKPIFGMVYAPVYDILWFGYFNNKTKRTEAYKVKGISGTGYITNSKAEKIITLKPDSLEDLTIVTSRYHSEEKTSKWVKDNLSLAKNKLTYLQRGSSIKLCMVADGSAHFYPRQGRTCVWDTAASHSILNGSGGSLIDLKTGKELTYSDSIYNPEFLASCWNYKLVQEFLGRI